MKAITYLALIVLAGFLLSGCNLEIPTTQDQSKGWRLNFQHIEDQLIERDEGVYRCFVSTGANVGGISCVLVTKKDVK